MKAQWIGNDQCLRKRMVLGFLHAQELIDAVNVVPMYTGEWPEGSRAQYLQGLRRAAPGAVVVTEANFGRTNSGHPGDYFVGLPASGDLFVDPDKGITDTRLGVKWDRWSEYAHIAIEEVTQLNRTGASRLTIVYDQTVMNGSPASGHAAGRVSRFHEAGLHACAWYWERRGPIGALVVVCVSADQNRINGIRERTCRVQWDGIT